jgi:5'-3' exonuclease
MGYNVIIDLSYIFYKSFSIAKSYGEVPLDLTTEEGKGYLIRKTTIDVCKIIRELNSDKVFICCDSPSFRKEVYPDYKNRGEKDPGFMETQLELIEIFRSKGINVVKTNHLEADDIMVLICDILEDEIKFIVTGDVDLHQRINNKTYVYNAKSDNKIFFHHNERQLRYKIKEGEEYTYKIVDPFLVLITKLIKGCNTDHVPGLAPKGFRTKKVEEICEKYRFLHGEDIVYENDLTEIINQYFPITTEQVYKQLQLVCLQNIYMHQSGVLEFCDTFEDKVCEITNWHFTEVLKGTKYID